MIALRLAWLSLRREWRAGELAVLLVALSTAVGALTGVGFLTDRIGRALDAQANEVLAADARVESEEALDPTLQPEAGRLGLAVARLTTLVSVVYHGDAGQLADLRAAGDGYPLRGVLRTAAVPFAAGEVTHALPAPGDCWPDSRLAAALGAGVGDVLSVGARELKVARILVARPDQGSAFVEFSPTLVINASDLASTQLVQPASRMRYALLLAGDAGALRRYAAWFRSTPRPAARLVGVAEASPQVGDAARRAGHFLALAGLVAVLLCAIAVAMGARTYVARHLDAVALMKTLGASRRLVLAVMLLQMLLLAVVASGLGAGAGWLTQRWLLAALAGLLRTDLPPAGFLPVAAGFVVALAMLAGFALPSLLQLTRVPALRVLRRDLDPPPLRLWFALLPAVLAVAGVVLLTAREWRLALWFTLALAATLALLGAAAWALVRAAGRVRGHAGVAVRFGLASLARRRAGSVAQVLAFGLGVMLLLVLAILRRDLVNDWRATLPAGAPNYFFLNIPVAQADEFRAALVAAGARPERMLPLLRGRLVAVNGRTDQAPRRELNLSWSAELGDDNRVTAGHWFTAAERGQPLVSVSTDFSATEDLKIGDRLDFDIAGERVSARVASLRKVRWDSFRPNFFLMFAPGLLDGVAGTYLTSARFEPRSAGDLAGLVRRFPGVTVFNVGDLLAQVRSVIDKAVVAVQSVFAFTLLAGLTVLLAAAQASRDERRGEAAILRALGATRAFLLRSALAEFVALGLSAGLLAATASLGAGWLMARTLDLRYHPDALLWASGVAGTVAAMALGGWLATRGALSALRQS